MRIFFGFIEDYLCNPLELAANTEHALDASV